MESSSLRYDQSVEPIAAGAYGAVYRAFDQLNPTGPGKWVAIKVLREEVKNFRHEDVINELLGAQLSHRHVQRVREISKRQVKVNGEVTTRVVIISDFLPNSNLWDYLQNDDNLNDEATCRLYFKQLIEAVEYCHARPLYHRDIKLDNIMLDEDRSVILIDFGLATVEQGEIKDFYVGTPGYQCPQIIRERPYTGEKMDIFALSVVLFQLLAKLDPFGEADDKFYKYLTQMPDEYWAYMEKIKGSQESPFFSKEFRKLFEGMAAVDENQRWTLQQVKESDWMKGKMATTKDLLEHAQKKEQEAVQERFDKREETDIEMMEMTENLLSRGKDDWVTEPQYRSAEEVSANTILVHHKPFVIEEILEKEGAQLGWNISSKYDLNQIDVSEIIVEKLVPCRDRLEFETIELKVEVKLQIFAAEDVQGKYYVEFNAKRVAGQNSQDYYKAFQLVKKELQKAAASTNVKVQIEEPTE